MLWVCFAQDLLGSSTTVACDAGGSYFGCQPCFAVAKCPRISLVAGPGGLRCGIHYNRWAQCLACDRWWQPGCLCSLWLVGCLVGGDQQALRDQATIGSCSVRWGLKHVTDLIFRDHRAGMCPGKWLVWVEPEVRGASLENYGSTRDLAS
jgi:hypothetical protein